MAVAAAIAGNTLEWFDFTVYGLFSIYIAKAFFPAGSRSIWHVPHRVRKLAVCRHSMPRPLGTVLRAWNKFAETLVRLWPTAGKRVRVTAPARAARASRPRSSGEAGICAVIDKPAGHP